MSRGRRPATPDEGQGCAGGAAEALPITPSSPDGEWLSYPPSVEPDLDGLTAKDRAALAGLRHLQRYAGSYAHVHGQRPHTLGLVLTDSPVGLLAWNSQAMGDLDRETLLTHVTIYWAAFLVAAATVTAAGPWAGSSSRRG
jgi:hypothetical protein